MKKEIQHSFSNWRELSEYFFNKENDQIYFLSSNKDNIHKGKIPICEIRVSKDKVILYLSTGNNVAVTDDILKNKLLILKELTVFDIIKLKPTLCKIWDENYKSYIINVVYDTREKESQISLDGRVFDYLPNMKERLEVLSNEEIKHKFFINVD